MFQPPDPGLMDLGISKASVDAFESDLNGVAEMRVFRGRIHFSASILILDFIKKILLMNPSLDPTCAGGGVHALVEMTG